MILVPIESTYTTSY